MTTETQQGASNVDIRAGNILSICSGIGGLDLGVHMASEDARTICYVEREAFAIASLVEAMEAGRLDQAPVWTDLRTFDGKAWRGVVDTLIGGIPCTPHSIAGLQRGEDDDRDLWGDTARIIADIQPGRVFLENVPGIAPYHFERIGPDLRAMGYSTETGLFSASEVGASHQRQRFFILAHRDGGQHEFAKQEVRSGRRTVNNGNGNVAHSEFQRRRGGSDGDTRGRGRPLQTEGRCGDVADADSNRTKQRCQCDSVRGNLRTIREGRDSQGEKDSRSDTYISDRDVADNNSRGRRENGIARGLGEMDEREADLSISTAERYPLSDVADADATRSQGRDERGHGGGERAARTSGPPALRSIPKRHRRMVTFALRNAAS